MYVYNIDLQYHAGQERRAGRSLADYLDHAAATGRRVVGLTDHIEIYLGDNDKTGPYERSVAGLAAYRADVDAIRTDYPDMQLRFGPEVGRGFDLETVPERVVELSDLFVCELSLPANGLQANTDAMIDRLDEIARFSDRVGRPVFVAHPFRSSINRRLVKREIEPWIRELSPQPPTEWSTGAVNEFFMFDVARFGQAAARAGVPLEINGNTHLRAQGANIPAAIQQLRAAYRLLQGAGATFVPGSDQHQFERRFGRRGGFVPWETFATVDVDIGDLGHLREFGIELPATE